eukprot:230307-Chlamydomonas_euryale.AAC.1
MPGPRPPDPSERRAALALQQSLSQRRSDRERAAPREVGGGRTVAGLGWLGRQLCEWWPLGDRAEEGKAGFVSGGHTMAAFGLWPLPLVDSRPAKVIGPRPCDHANDPPPPEPLTSGL